MKRAIEGELSDSFKIFEDQRLKGNDHRRLVFKKLLSKILPRLKGIVSHPSISLVKNFMRTLSSYLTSIWRMRALERF